MVFPGQSLSRPWPFNVTIAPIQVMSRSLKALAFLALFALFRNLDWFGKQQSAVSSLSSFLKMTVLSSDEQTEMLAKGAADTYPIIDILSVGSTTRPDHQRAQKATFGKHPSIRHFFAITEQDDVDQDCHDRLTLRDVLQISGFCGGLRKDIQNTHRLLYDFKNKFANPEWLQRTKKSPVGWMCAQKRPMAGFGKALQTYRQNSNDTKQPQQLDLPDFLVIMDDDTYYNMESVVQGLKEIQEDHPLSDGGLGGFVVAGCLIRSKLKRFRWSFPFGGWGTIFSRDALEAMLQPLHCGDLHDSNSTSFIQETPTSKDTDASFYSSLFCPKLMKDRIGELKVYRDGMSLADLMYRYVMREPYTDHANWDVGVCLHSDWVWGCKYRALRTAALN